MGDDERSLDQAIDELYQRGPAEFVAARNALVRDLRRQGKREEAAGVAKLRRPSPAAWAVNQLARHHRDRLDDLLRLGDELQSAQAGALAGGDADTLREAGRARRDAVARLVDTAAGILAERGSGADTHRGAIAATLDAASLDPEAGREILGGRLTTELSAPSGFGEVEPPVARPAMRRARRDHDGDDDGARAAAQEAARQRAARQVAKERAAEAERAESRAAAARRRVDKAEAEVANAERALREARRRVQAADAEVVEAEQAAVKARHEANSAATAADE